MSKLNLSNPLPMSDAEILASYNNAIQPSKQCKILAELNATSVERIKEILLRMGVDGRRLPRKKLKEGFELTGTPCDPSEKTASEATEAPPAEVALEVCIEPATKRKRGELCESVIFCAVDMVTQLTKAASDLMGEIKEHENRLRQCHAELEDVQKILSAAKHFKKAVESL